MSIVFQLLLVIFVLFSFLMVVAVPVAYASPSNWNTTKPLLLAGSLLWAVLVILLGIFNSFIS